MPQSNAVEIAGLDHINIQTPVLEDTCAFFESIVGLKRGFRPDFPFPGAWLHLGEKAVVHVIGMTDKKAGGAGSGRVNHVGFMASGYANLLDRVLSAGMRTKSAMSPAPITRPMFRIGAAGAGRLQFGVASYPTIAHLSGSYAGETPKKSAPENRPRGKRRSRVLNVSPGFQAHTRSG
jgi:catechol 2,3-dioxygenase-like lactoylglutathione lyase family enzyme